MGTIAISSVYASFSIAKIDNIYLNFGRANELIDVYEKNKAAEVYEITTGLANEISDFNGKHASLLTNLENYALSNLLITSCTFIVTASGIFLFFTSK